ncbi:unnamed protein product, partial [marine sediment metagenome]
LDKLYRKYDLKNVIDLGCGTGTFLIKLFEKGYQCYGVDRNEETIQVAKNIAKSMNYKIGYDIGDMQNIELEKVFGGFFCIC